MAKKNQISVDFNQDDQRVIKATLIKLDTKFFNEHQKKNYQDLLKLSNPGYSQDALNSRVGMYLDAATLRNLLKEARFVRVQWGLEESDTPFLSFTPVEEVTINGKKQFILDESKGKMSHTESATEPPMPISSNRPPNQ